MLETSLLSQGGLSAGMHIAPSRRAPQGPGSGVPSAVQARPSSYFSSHRKRALRLCIFKVEYNLHFIFVIRSHPKWVNEYCPQ